VSTRAVLMWMIAGFTIRSAFAEVPPSPVPPEVEKAVLVEDWAKVAELIGDVKPDAPAPLRLVMGHACLALNRNNDSVLLFLTTNTPEKLKEWQDWAKGFKQMHQDAVIADYFFGDSLGRVGKYEEAVVAFKSRLKTNPQHVLLLNAQGLCYAKLGKVTVAHDCFDAAIAASGGRFADSYANVGSCWIEKSEAPEGAIRAFNMAISNSVGFALALIGRGEVKGVIGDNSGPCDLNNGLSQCDPLRPLVALQLIEQALRRSGANSQEAAEEMADIGTSLKKDFRKDELVRSATWWGAVAETFRNDQRLGWFGKAIGNFAGDRMVDKFTAINDIYGAKALNEAIGHNDITRRVGPVEIKRSGSYNRGALGTERAVADIAGLGAIGANYLASKVPVNARVGVGMTYAGLKTTEFTAKKTLDWSTRNNNMFKAVDAQWFQSSSSGPKNLPREMGGADLSMKRANWEEGNWPFKPIYGLAYGMSLPIAAPPIAPDHAKLIQE